MKITVFDTGNAPTWVKVWNLANLFLAGVALGHLWGVGWESSLLPHIALYLLVYLLLIGSTVLPRKKVEFPGEFLQHLKSRR